MPKAITKVLFLQFLPIGGYPPLLNLIRSVRATSDTSVLCWEVQDYPLPRPSEFSSIIWRSVLSNGGKLKRLSQKIKYAGLALLALSKIRPDVIFVADPVSAWLGCLISLFFRKKLIYVEYDAPVDEGWRAMKQRVPRYLIGRLASNVLVPNHARKKAFIESTGRRGPVEVLMNFPARSEICSISNLDVRVADHVTLSLYYQGSLVPERVPEELIRAVSQTQAVSLTIRGVQPHPDNGYHQRLSRLIYQLNCADRIFLKEALDVSQLKDEAVLHDIGIAFFSAGSNDPNLQKMWGASNKIYQYMAYGLLVLYSSEEPELIDQMVGHGVRCNMGNVEDICRQLVYLKTHSSELLATRRHCLQKITSEWNFESQFLMVIAPLLETPYVESGDGF